MVQIPKSTALASPTLGDLCQAARIPSLDPICFLGKWRYTKHQIERRLFAASLDDAINYPIWFASNGVEHRGFLQEIQREDGSGRSFNITVSMPGGGLDTFHIRTLD